MKRLVLLINCIFIIIGFLSIATALFSPMLFDAPGSENNNFVWMMFWSLLSIPLTCLISVVWSMIIFYHSANYKKALWISLIPCIPIAVTCISVTLIQIFCHGLFSCPT